MSRSNLGVVEGCQLEPCFVQRSLRIKTNRIEGDLVDSHPAVLALALAAGRLR